METIEYKSHDRTRWPSGEWDNEPDKIQWQDPTTKLPCLMVRNKLGAWCGYVGVPQDHSAYERFYDDVAAEVHGGLTYSDKCAAEPEEKSICHIPGTDESDDVWWLGFDCSHGGDAYPEVSAAMLFDTSFGSYKNQKYVTEQVTSLAAQLAGQVTREVM